MASPLVIEVRDYSFRYESTHEWALNSVTLTASEGTVVGLIGRNGAGKSTLCKAIGGIIALYYAGEMQGKIFLTLGHDRVDLTAGMDSRVSVFIESPSCYSVSGRFSVAEEIQASLENRGVMPKVIERTVLDLAEQLGISGLLGRNPTELSGGEGKLVSLACALVVDAELLVLDEPTGQLDATHKELLRDIILTRKRKGQLTVLADHDYEFLAAICEKIVVLNNGKVVCAGSPGEVFRSEVVTKCGVGTTYWVTLFKGLIAAGEFRQDTPLPVTFQEAAQACREIP